MNLKKTFLNSASLCLCGLIFLLSFAVTAQVPQPKDIIGFTPGDDRKLASWAKIIEYFQKLDAASDRVKFEEIGKSTMGAPFVYATISSPENLRNLEKYKQINAKLADPRTIGTRTLLSARGESRETAEQLIKQGKTIVLITCGVHSDEVGSTLSSMLIAYKLASSNEPEIRKILENTIILLVPSLNPDGVDIINNWYQKTLGTKFEGTDPPELYNKYVGHDDNRDWYAFTQIETQLTVDKIHNVWHPQIVNDIHQQGENGSRLFLPPYKTPVEPNVPKQIVEGYTELGNYIAADLRSHGFQGITTDSTYDAWTPSRAYSHYHGGVRILSETASCKLATPVNVKFDDLRPGLGYDPKVASPTFGPVWHGGEWHLRDITNYMTTAAFSLLHNAADNREHWLTNFYAIGKEAVRPRKRGEFSAYIVEDNADTFVFQDILERAGVEYENKLLGTDINNTQWTLVIKSSQPYFGFAKAILETQAYPDLKDKSGSPIPPYDVTAHTISLLHGFTFKPVTIIPRKPRNVDASYYSNGGCPSVKPTAVQVYRSLMPAIDEGWTRFILTDKQWREATTDCSRFSIVELRNEKIRQNDPGLETIIFPDQAPNQILNGYAKGTMPDEYTGGVGKEGVENLKKFVEAGGTLVFLNRASDFAIEQFNLPIRDVTKGLARKDFYIPGSILRTELDTTNPIAKGMPKDSIAWFESGPAFEVLSGVRSPTVREGSTQSDEQALTDVRATDTVTVIARYPSDPKQILLSGWALGAEKIAGKAALVSVTMGKGKIILFGFRPQYRGQSLATFPLLFNSISQ